MKIGCDLDGTVFQTYERMIEKYNLTHTDTISSSIIMDFSQLPSHQLLWVQKYFTKIKSYFNIPPYPDAIPVLKKLSGSHNMIFITSRDETTRKISRYQLSKYGLTNPLYIVKREEKPYLGEALNIEVMIEDELGFAKSFYERGIKIILLDRPWNQDKTLENSYSSDWKRVYQWNEVYQIICELVKKKKGGEK